MASIQLTLSDNSRKLPWLPSLDACPSLPSLFENLTSDLALSCRLAAGPPSLSSGSSTTGRTARRRTSCFDLVRATTHRSSAPLLSLLLNQHRRDFQPAPVRPPQAGGPRPSGRASRSEGRGEPESAPPDGGPNSPGALPLSGSEPVYDDRDVRWWDPPPGAECGTYSYALRDYRAEGRGGEDAHPGDVARAKYASEAPLAPPPQVESSRDFVKQVLSDNPDRLKVVKADAACPAGHYKVMAFIDPAGMEDGRANFPDHHWYVQHRDAVVTLEEDYSLQDAASTFEVPLEELLAANPGVSARAAADPQLAVGAPTVLHMPGLCAWSHKPSPSDVPRLHDGKGRLIRDPRQADPWYSDDEDGVLELPSRYCCTLCVPLDVGKRGLRTGR